LTRQTIPIIDVPGLAYYKKNLPVLKERIYLAGVRLAKVSNECSE
jgi:hypothetical protein